MKENLKLEIQVDPSTETSCLIHLWVFPFIYQFNSRIVTLVCSSFSNDYLVQKDFNIISASIQNLFVVILTEKECSFYTYRISANSFRGNYSFLNLALFTVTFDIYFINLNSCRGNYSREETIQGRKLFAEIR